MIANMTPPPIPAAPPVFEPTPDPAGVLERLAPRLQLLQEEVAKVIIGQEEIISAALYALFSRGHCLLVGVPGLAKTLLVHSLARSLELGFSRIQFTPDLMPSDITGTEILEEDTSTGHRRFAFVRGPVFTQVLLADEINRTPPKTQAALLEAMQEKTVTVGGKMYQLEEPFMVLATQNPIEQEGTYPLPEAQLDRFLFELLVDYPTLEEERRVVEQHSFAPLERIQPVLTREEVLQFRSAIAQIPAAPNVIDYAVRLVRATRPGGNGQAPEYIKRWIRWGASPRASQHLILAGRARAACQGRFNVACEDVAALAPLVLRHRLIRTFQADAEGKTTDDIIAQLLQDVPRE
ncbi:MAG TPA: MoxR family ATPase [Candidatus Binatia bacterium]|jgi:MoxR-like ATPase|nr:MoxR family ATPase [Candidatus Binatia bacterium]